MSRVHLFLSSSIVLIIFLAFFGLNVQFLRGENAVFMHMSLLPSGQWQAIKPFLTAPYNGHFTPVAFLLEFLSAKLFGAHETAWFLRQTLVLSALAAVFFLTIKSVRNSGWLSALAFTAILCLNPMMVSLHSWPFMWMQLATLTCASLALGNLVDFCKTGSARSAWFAVLSGYASMHFFGLGLGFSVATIIITYLIAICRGNLSGAIRPVSWGVGLTALHSAVMALGNRPSGLELFDAVLRFFALTVEQPVATIRSIFATGWLVSPDLSSIKSQAVCGVAVAALAFYGLWKSWRKSREQSVVRPELVAVTFALLSFYSICALTAFRLKGEAGGEVLAPFLFGDRYIVFPLFSMVIMFSAFVSFDKFASLIVTAGVAAYTITFSVSVVPHLWPDRLVSHKAFWNELKRSEGMPQARINAVTEIPISRCSLSAGTFPGCERPSP